MWFEDFLLEPVVSEYPAKWTEYTCCMVLARDSNYASPSDEFPNFEADERPRYR